MPLGKVGTNEGSQMPRHLISDAHEWIKSIKVHKSHDSWNCAQESQVMASLPLIVIGEMGWVKATHLVAGNSC